MRNETDREVQPGSVPDFRCRLCRDRISSRQSAAAQCETEILENARIMIEAALAVRAYTNTHIKPLLETQLKYTFLPESVPAISANQYFANLRKKFPDYSYKEATLNPTNPVNRATDWEADIIRYFRQSPQQTELIGERETPNGRVLYIAPPDAHQRCQVPSLSRHS
jgi:protein-histidine pros-kinase